MKSEQTGDKVSVSVADMQQWLEALGSCDTDYGGHQHFDYVKVVEAIASLRDHIADAGNMLGLDELGGQSIPVQPLPSDHVCGLQGFDGMRDECPGCERNRAYRASAPTTAEGESHG